MHSSTPESRVESAEGWSADDRQHIHFLQLHADFFLRLRGHDAHMRAHSLAAFRPQLIRMEMKAARVSRETGAHGNALSHANVLLPPMYTQHACIYERKVPTNAAAAAVSSLIQC